MGTFITQTRVLPLLRGGVLTAHMKWATSERVFARVFASTTRMTGTTGHLCGQKSTSERSIIAEVPTPRRCMRGIRIVNRAEQRLPVFLESRSSRRNAIWVRAETLRCDTLAAKGKARQPFSVLLWPQLLAFADGKFWQAYLGVCVVAGGMTAMQVHNVIKTLTQVVIQKRLRAYATMRGS